MRMLKKIVNIVFIQVKSKVMWLELNTQVASSGIDDVFLHKLRYLFGSGTNSDVCVCVVGTWERFSHTKNKQFGGHLEIASGSTGCEFSPKLSTHFNANSKTRLLLLLLTNWLQIGSYHDSEKHLVY